MCPLRETKWLLSIIIFFLLFLIFLLKSSLLSLVLVLQFLLILLLALLVGWSLDPFGLGLEATRLAVVERVDLNWSLLLP